MDAVYAAIAALRSTGVPAYADVPRERPERFITVERTGGGASDGLDHPELAVQAWGPTNREAWLLMALADDEMRHLPMRCRDVMGVERESLAHWPDPDSRAQRWQGVYALTTAL